MIRERKVKLNYDTDSVDISLKRSHYDGDLEFDVSVWRQMKGGKNYESTTYTLRMPPESVTCAIRSLKRAVRESIDNIQNRIGDLERDL